MRVQQCVHFARYLSIMYIQNLASSNHPVAATRHAYFILLFGIRSDTG